MLEVKGLSKRLPTGKTILNDISFRVDKGEFVALLGASGAGKSMTMRAIAGLTSVTAGEVVFSGESGKCYTTITASGKTSGKDLRRARRNIGVIFQGSNLVKRLPVLDNVMIGRLGRIHPLRSWLYGFTDQEASEAMASLERVGMAGFASRRTGSLSGGEVQRVAIARAIFQRPLLYLADEPVSSLDPKNAEAIMQLMQPLAREHPILGAFHQPGMVMHYCTRVIALHKGSIIYNGAPNLSAKQLDEIYCGQADRPEATQELTAAAES